MLCFNNLVSPMIEEEMLLDSIGRMKRFQQMETVGEPVSDDNINN